jgi:uncharacterized protein (TIGR00297 family)
MLVLTLDMKGLALAVAMGAAFVLLGMQFGIFFILTMLFFLVLSAIVTKAGHDYKRRLFGKESERRGMKNVVANGTAPLITAIAFFIAAMSGLGRLEALCVIGFVSSVAAITADKFESEIGIFESGFPRTIFTMKKVKKGTSGAVTLTGLLSGMLGSLLVALLLILVVNQLQPLYAAHNSLASSAVISVLVGGFFGSIVDSMFGYFEEKGIGNKYTSNLACGICGAVIGALVFILIAH